MNTFSGDFWWKDIAGPQNFVKRVTEILTERHIPLLSVPADIPWRHSMRTAVVEKLNEIHPDISPNVFTIDVSDECPENNIGEFLLQKFADKDVADAYRPRSGKTVQAYLTAQEVLANKIIWVKGLEPVHIEAWMKFCRQFKPCSLETGTFIVESRDPVPALLPEIFQPVEFVQFVSHYDAILFNNLLMSEKEPALTNLRQGYISVAAAHLCEFDAELSEALLQDERWFQKAPQEMLQELAEEEPFSRRGERSGSRHILALLRANEMPEIMQRLWTAQIQVLFPILELQRLWIIEQLRSQLEYIVQTKYVEQFKQRLCSPDEIELGTLVFLMAKHDDGDRWLYVPDDSLRNAIFKLRDCRNLLAHRHQCCSPEDVDFILSFEETRIAAGKN